MHTTDISQVTNEGTSANKKAQKQTIIKTTNVQMKRKGRQLGGSTMLARKIGDMEDCVKVMTQTSESAANMQPSTFIVSKAMQANNVLVEKQCWRNMMICGFMQLQ